MEVFMPIALILVFFLYLWGKSKKNAAPTPETADAERQAILEELEVYRTLRDSIRQDMSLHELILAFANMCSMDVGDTDELLFETGTNDSKGVNLFHLDLIRQFQHTDDKKGVRLHLCIYSTPDSHTEGLQTSHQGENGDGMFFSTVCASKEYQLMKTMPFRAEVRVEGT